jgi:hypothetical protein
MLTANFVYMEPQNICNLQSGHQTLKTYVANGSLPFKVRLSVITELQISVYSFSCLDPTESS